MPVKSDAQRRLMYAALRDPKGVGIPRSVAEKFVGPKAHSEGGALKESEMKKPMPAFLMKKGDKKAEAKKHAKKMMGGGKAYAKGGEIPERPPVPVATRPRGPGMEIPLVEATDSGYGGNYTRSGRIDRQYAKGGGIESKGKTRGTMVKMMGGGKC